MPPEQFDEDYVLSILDEAAIKKPATSAAFDAMCRWDIRGDREAEVMEARRRYFEQVGERAHA
jgi:hypothetical protein